MRFGGHILRRLVIGVLGVMMLMVHPLPNAGAQVCWCRAADMPERVKAADQVFTLRIDELIPKDERNAVAYGEVVEAVKGDVPERVRVGLRLGTTCVNLDDLIQGVVVGVIGRKGRYQSNGVCDERSTERALDMVLSPIPQPQGGEGRPAFLVPNGRLGARLAVLDEHLRTAFVGSGLGRIEAVAVCPGGRFAVEIVVNTGSSEMSLETRSLETLEITEVRSLEMRRRDMSGVTDLACHDDEATRLSYLVVNGQPRGVAREAARRESAIEVWLRGELAAEIPARDARRLLVDVDRGMAYTLSRGPLARVDRFELEDGRFDRFFELGDAILADFALDRETGDVVILAGNRVEQPKKKHGKGHLIRISGDDVAATEIRKALRPRLLELVDGRVHALVDIRGEGLAYQVRDRKGKVLEETLVARAFPALLVPNDDLILVSSGPDLRLYDSTGLRSAIGNTFRGAVAAVPLSYDIEITSGDLPPIETANGSIVAGGPVPPSRRAPAVATRSRLPWMLAAAGASLVGVSAVVAIRRRRPDADREWMGRMRDEGPAG